MSGRFSDLVGQDPAVGLLEAALAQQRLAPAYLFAGPEGVGRRLAALRFLEGVLEEASPAPALRRRLQEGNHPDLLWVEPTHQHQGQLVPLSRAESEGVNRRARPQIRLEQVREVSRFLARRPVEGGRCLVVMDGVELMAEAASNALLKTLEEPGESLLILITSAPHQLLDTIRSRCQRIPFRPLSRSQIAEVLQREHGASGMEPPGRDGDDTPELWELAAGSPGLLMAVRRRWSALPDGLTDRLLALEPDPLAALSLARDLSEALDVEQQLWLLEWWALALWRRRGKASDLARIEQLRRHLQAYVQPRLAWEVALLDLTSGPLGAGR